MMQNSIKELEEKVNDAKIFLQGFTKEEQLEKLLNPEYFEKETLIMSQPGIDQEHFNKFILKKN